MILKDRKLVPVSRLKPAGHNPARRTAKENLVKLVDSMDLIGLLQPITITKDYVIIEGHRRWAAAKQLKWKEIEANVMEGDPALIYASVNVTMRPMSGNDALGVWLANDHAVMPRTAGNFAKMEQVVGRELVRRMYKVGLSRAAYLLALRLAKYCDSDTPETVTAILEWFMEFMTIGQVRKAMEAGQDPRVILKAVRTGKPIKMQVALAG